MAGGGRPCFHQQHCCWGMACVCLAPLADPADELEAEDSFGEHGNHERILSQLIEGVMKEAKELRLAQETRDEKTLRLSGERDERAPGSVFAR